MVAMMLRWLPEDITVHNEDLEGLEKWTFQYACLVMMNIYILLKCLDAMRL